MFRQSLSLSTGALVFLGVIGFPGPLQAQHFRGGFRAVPGMMPFAPQMTRFTPNVMMPFSPGMARFTPNGVMPFSPGMTGFTSNGMMQPTSGMMRFTSNGMTPFIPNGMMPFTTGMGSPGFSRQPFRAEFERTNRHFDQIFSPLGLDPRMFFQTGFNSPMFNGF
jgi:hypothetical protein